MKRPEGFDPRGPEAQDPQPRPEAGAREQQPRQKRQAKPRPQKQEAAKPRREPRPKRPRTPSASRGRPAQERDSAAEARKAARARRRYERGEVRRFTRRTRRRRITWLVSLGALGMLCAVVALAVYSPLLALREIKVEGASRVSSADIRSALRNQLDTPLALLDSSRIKQDLARFPLIRSYVTETVPPHTLIVHVVERSPLAVLERASDYVVVDAAGVTISHADERPPKLPIIDTGSDGTDSTAFRAAVSVLLALPTSVAEKVDTVSARTTDDVTLGLDKGQRVVWGSSDRSALKARVLAALLSHKSPSAAMEYDVSAPNSPVIRSE